MATGTVIHFGKDDCSRIPALKNAGYEVLESDTLDRLKLHLERGEGVDAVIICGMEPSCTIKAASLARQRSSAPLILFRRPDVKHSLSRFDRVFPAHSPNAHWLFETAVLVMQCKELRAQAESLRTEAGRVLKETSAVQTEGRRQLARAAGLQRRRSSAWPDSAEAEKIA